MTQIHNFADVHRHRDRSIDFDYYRARAVALRGAAMQDASKLRSMFKFTIVSAAAITGIVLVAASPAPVIDAPCSRCTPNVVAMEAQPAAMHITGSIRTSQAE